MRIKTGNQINYKGIKRLVRNQVASKNRTIKILSLQLADSNRRRAQIMTQAQTLYRMLQIEKRYKWIVPKWIDQIKVWWRKRWNKNQPAKSVPE